MSPQERKKREERIKKICANINEEMKKEDAVTYIGSGDSIAIERFPSGSPELDRALGGGWPRGRFIELMGPEAGGKTILCLHGIAEFQKYLPDEDIALVDTEHCLAQDTLVYDAEAMAYRPIQELCELKEFFVSSWVNGKMIKQKAKASISGERPVYLIRCSHGRSIRLTDNHRVLTQDGYRDVASLKDGDTMFTPFSVPSLAGNSADNKDLYKVLGYHIGDGTIGKSEISTIDFAVVRDLEEIAAKYDCSVTFKGTMARFRKNNLKFYDISRESLTEMFDSGLLIEEAALLCECSAETLSRRIKEYGLDKLYNFKKMAALARNNRDTDTKKAKSDYHGGLKSKIYEFLSGFACFHEYSGDRRLPGGLSDCQLSLVLAGMFMADGCVINPEKQHRCAVYYSTTSRNLAMDVQAVLQRFGIFSSLGEYQKPRDDGNGFYDKSYGVWIHGHHDVKKFSEVVCLSGYKHDYLMASVNSVNPATSVGIARKRGKGLIGLEVLSVEGAGKAVTYDVSVVNPNNDEQNFLAEGLIVHNSFDEKYAKAIGVDTDLVLVNQPESGEEALNVVRKLVHNNVGLIIVDSVAALVPQAELDGDIGDVHVAQQARLMSQAMRMLCAEAGSRKVTIFWTNQMRDKIGTFYGEKTTTPGGRALRHYASVRVSISPIARIKDGEEVVGTKVRADVKKNKVAAPFKKAEFYISFGTGIDRVAALCDEAIARKVVKKHRKQIFLPSADNPKEGEILGEGRLSFIETVKNNKKLFDQLDELVKKAPPPESEEAKAADEGEGEKTAETDAGKKIKKPKSMGGDVTRVPVTEDNALPDGDEAGAQVETTDV
jgi:recombination protein RecA